MTYDWKRSAIGLGFTESGRPKKRIWRWQLAAYLKSGSNIIDQSGVLGWLRPTVDLLTMTEWMLRSINRSHIELMEKRNPLMARLKGNAP